MVLMGSFQVEIFCDSDQVNGVASSSTLTSTVSKTLQRSLREERRESFCWGFCRRCLVEVAARSCWCDCPFGLVPLPELRQCGGLPVSS